MTLNKSISSGKEWRKPRRSYSIFCQNNKGCPFCYSNRLIRTKKEILKAKESEKI